ncbi:MAG: hypothetical protein JNL30_14355 [Rubrivivax sp.]|nr:hypothetical protein [Rubrivivax sp.]
MSGALSSGTSRTPGTPGLPAGFEDLETQAAERALESEQARYNRRIATPMAELQRSYDAVFPRLGDIMRFLSQHPADTAELEPRVRRLFYLALACVEA